MERLWRQPRPLALWHWVSHWASRFWKGCRPEPRTTHTAPKLIFARGGGVGGTWNAVNTRWNCIVATPVLWCHRGHLRRGRCLMLILIDGCWFCSTAALPEEQFRTGRRKHWLFYEIGEMRQKKPLPPRKALNARHAKQPPLAPPVAEPKLQPRLAAPQTSIKEGVAATALEKMYGGVG